jgi:hypothetical protein
MLKDLLTYLLKQIFFQQNHEKREAEAYSVVSPRQQQQNQPTFQDRQTDWFSIQMNNNRPKSSQGRRTEKVWFYAVLS